MTEVVSTGTLVVFDADAAKIGALWRKTCHSLVDSTRGRGYVECGLRLIAKKESLPHGQWLPWLEANAEVLGFQERAARLMMEAAANRQSTTEQAYAHGRMLDNSGWQAYGVCASDIDLVFNNRAAHASLVCELSRTTDDWNGISQEERRLYENLITGAAHVAVHCRHEITPEHGRQINPRHDIVSYQLMAHDRAHGFVLSPVVHSNDKWRRLVVAWKRDPGNPAIIRQRVLNYSAKILPLVR